MHFALGQRAGHFQQAIRERGFAVVDVRNDAEVSNELRVHISRLAELSRFEIPDYRFSVLPAGIRIACLVFPAGLAHSNERHTQPACRRQGKNHAVGTISLPQFEGGVSLAEEDSE
jgi:hypothetical protein